MKRSAQDIAAIIEQNRLSWNAVIEAHNSHKGNQGIWLKNGGHTLFPEELMLLGDLEGKSLLHLLCNCGQDTLSLARMGAEVTGVDISDEAIKVARELSQTSQIPAQFFRANVYEWLQQPPYGPFDVVFMSYGVLYWLPDLKSLFKNIRGILNPGGKVVFVDFHPVFWLFDDNWKLAYPYTSAGEDLLDEEGIGDYVGMSGEALVPWGFEEGIKDFNNPQHAHGFLWGMADIIGAMLEAGLQLEVFEEYPYSNGFNPRPDIMHVDADRRCWLPKDMPSIPLMFALRAGFGRP